MPERPADQGGLDPRTAAFYRHALTVLIEADVPFLVGGAYALQHYTGLERHTKDVDVLLRPHDHQRALQTLGAAGYRIEGVFHWVGKAYSARDCVDVIWSGTNGIPTVDDGWFAHAVAAEVVGLPLHLCPPEELIWAKAFVMERERYDGADVAHLLHACARTLDWRRLLERFRPHWRVLLSHLILFGFVYPDARGDVPAWVLRDVLGRLQEELTAAPEAAQGCQGTLLSWRQYLPDVEQQGYRDARLVQGYLTGEEIARWTAAFRDA